MINQAMQDAIKRAIETGDFRSVHDYFADDVELKIAMAVGSPHASEQARTAKAVGGRRIGRASRAAQSRGRAGRRLKSRHRYYRRRAAPRRCPLGGRTPKGVLGGTVTPTQD